MVFIFVLAVSLHAPFAQEVQQAYGRQDARTLRSLLAQADSRADSLLVRYRLYPLTKDASLLADLPKDLPDGSAHEHALLSGLWSYRAGEASIFHVIQYGRRSAELLERAKTQAPSDPFVLLVEGQSLLFRPAIAGRDVEAAVECFERLAAQADSATGITKTEAEVWCWLALKEAGRREQANRLHRRLLSQKLAPLYRQFLEAPPEM